jgi:predicted AAA+ superfamily ATPase
MINHTNQLEESRLLEHRLIYGYYPEIVTTAGEEKELLSLLSDSYLYKDLLTLGHIKKSALLEKLLQALALQLGNQVSYNELGRLVGADNATIERYLDLLEKAFIIFRLPSLSRNLRNELKKSRKVYFYDNGIRNAIIKSFNPLAIRNDIGPLWENFLISERTKRNHYAGYWVNRWFWRTLSQQEIDYIEEYNGKLYAYEFKWNPGSKAKFPKSFSKAYPGSETKAITTENYLEFITT